jgi:hypothetical protein
MSFRKVLIMACMFMVLSGVSIADNPFARAEMGGVVTSVFPEAGLIMIDGSRYKLANDVQILDISGNALEGGVKALQSGMSIQYGSSGDANNPGISVIIVSRQ